MGIGSGLDSCFAAFSDELGEFQKKCVDFKPGELFTVADIAGPGLITRIWVTLQRRINPGSVGNLVLKMYWDGEEEPAVYDGTAYFSTV